METEVFPQSRKIKLHSGQEIPCLLEEIIIEEILPKLPVKSLLRFRCVSKSWCSLISSKKFMKSHLRNSIKSSNLAHHRIVFHTNDGFKHSSLPSLFNGPFTDAITDNADLGINCRRDVIYLVGSCNGLVCILRKHRNFILWNPTTKKSTHLPGFDYKIRGGYISRYGFGFDELNDDYKVFAILSVNARRGVYFQVCKVYSLRSNSWEVIEGKGAFPFDEKRGTYLSGKLHWGVLYGSIVSFDLNSKVYGVVELPCDLKNHRLGVFNGCLSVHYYHDNSHVDIWVMKEYGVKESWNKVVTVPYYHCPHSGFLSRPFTISPNGEVLLKYGIEMESTLLIYNPKVNVLRHPRITDDARLTFLDLVIYVESLASVDPHAQQEN